MIDLFISIIIPSFILMKFSGEDALGATQALIIALSFPLGWGLFELIKNKKFNFITLLGLVSVLLTGGIGLLKEGLISPMKFCKSSGHYILGALRREC